MARVRDNLITEGLSGKLGKRLVFRKGRGGKTILATLPAETGTREFNEAQRAHQEAFSQAVDYAKTARFEPLYIDLAKEMDSTAYNLAIADWFGKPEVVAIDASAWTGQGGQLVRIKAKDDTRVSCVRVVIHSNGTIFEEGDAMPASTDGSAWTYTTKINVPTTPAPMLDAYAYDEPGHFGTMSVQMN